MSMYLQGEWRSGQIAPPGILKVLGSNLAFFHEACYMPSSVEYS